MFNILYILIEQPIINILVAFYQGLFFLNVPYALGFAIILLTVFIRLIMYPLTASQLKMQKKMQELAPHLSKVKEKHKGDTKRQQEATMALYKEHGLNPAAGCLPGIVQIVILLFGLYPALTKVIALNPTETVKVINSLVYFPFLKLSSSWGTQFFGIALAKNPSELIKTIGPLILLVPILTGLFQFIQSKMMMSPTKAGLKEIENKDKKEDFAATFQKQSLYLLPVMIGFFSWQFSIGLSLYWNTFTVFGIIQQYFVSGWGGLTPLINKLKGNN